MGLRATGLLATGLRALTSCVLLSTAAGVACSAEEVQPASSMPGESRGEASGGEMGVGTLGPAPTGAPMGPGGMSLPESEDGTPPEARPSPPAPPSSTVPPRSGAPLPDLVLDGAYLLDSVRFETQRISDPCLVQQGCATGLGERRVVRFGSRMGNLGNADFELGAPNAQNPLWTQDSCGDGFSLRGFARYELRDASGQLVLQGSKSQFCITDAEEWIPESGANCQTFSCGRQGIAPGCADNYGIDLPCQWLDITDVPPGEYELEVTLNAERSVAELDYENNSVTLPLRIGGASGSLAP